MQNSHDGSNHFKTMMKNSPMDYYSGSGGNMGGSGMVGNTGNMNVSQFSGHGGNE
jgi:hypothetical protein